MVSLVVNLGPAKWIKMEDTILIIRIRQIGLGKTLTWNPGEMLPISVDSSELGRLQYKTASCASIPCYVVTVKGASVCIVIL